MLPDMCHLFGDSCCAYSDMKATLTQARDASENGSTVVVTDDVYQPYRKPSGRHIFLSSWTNQKLLSNPLLALRSIPQHCEIPRTIFLAGPVFANLATGSDDKRAFIIATDDSLRLLPQSVEHIQRCKDEGDHEQCVGIDDPISLGFSVELADYGYGSDGYRCNTSDDVIRRNLG